MRLSSPLASRSSAALGLVAATTTIALAVALLTCAGSLARADEPARRRAVTQEVAPAEVPAKLSQRGYAVTEPVVRRGSTYLTHGTDRYGQRLRLVMDARNGELIGLRVVGGPRPRREAERAP
jgi:hypothetical protein